MLNVFFLAILHLRFFFTIITGVCRSSVGLSVACAGFNYYNSRSVQRCNGVRIGKGIFFLEIFQCDIAFTQCTNVCLCPFIDFQQKLLYKTDTDQHNTDQDLDAFVAQPTYLPVMKIVLLVNFSS